MELSIECKIDMYDIPEMLNAIEFVIRALADKNLTQHTERIESSKLEQVFPKTHTYPQFLRKIILTARNFINNLPFFLSNYECNLAALIVCREFNYP